MSLLVAMLAFVIFVILPFYLIGRLIIIKLFKHKEKGVSELKSNKTDRVEYLAEGFHSFTKKHSQKTS